MWTVISLQLHFLKFLVWSLGSGWLGSDPHVYSSGVSPGVYKKPYVVSLSWVPLSLQYSQYFMAPWGSFFWSTSQKWGVLVPWLCYVLLCNGVCPTFLESQEGFHPCRLLCHHCHWVAWYLGHERMEREKRKPIWPLKVSFPHPWARTREFLLEISLFMLMPTFGFHAVLCLDWGQNGKHTINLVIFWILVFILNLLATIYFSASSNSCSMNLSRFYSCIRWERWGECAYCVLPAWR